MDDLKCYHQFININKILPEEKHLTRITPPGTKSHKVIPFIRKLMTLTALIDEAKQQQKKKSHASEPDEKTELL